MSCRVIMLVFFYRKQCKASVVFLSTDDFEMYCVC